MSNSGQEIFDNLKLDLMEAKLISQDAMGGTVLKMSKPDIYRDIELKEYINNFKLLLLDVPTYVSNYSYIYKQVSNIERLCEVLKSMHEVNVNQNTKQYLNSLDTNTPDIQMQLLSKLFSEEMEVPSLLRYIYVNSFGSWISDNLNKMEYEEIVSPKYEDENNIMYDVRVLGQRILDIYNYNKAY